MDIEHAQIGRRAREIRNWRGMTLTAAAGLAGLSTGYLSLIERGERAITKRSVLESIARALRVSPGDLTGRPYEPTDEASAEARTAMATLADVLGAWWIGEVPDVPSRPLPDLLDDLHQFNTELRATANYAAQADMIPDLILGLLVAAADPQTGRDALVPLLNAYHGAGSLAARLGFPGLPSLAADRIERVAKKLDDPVWLGVSAWSRAHFLSGTNRKRQYHLAVSAADSAPAEHPETRGMAHLTAALAAAAQNQADVAETHLHEASELAEQVEPDVSPWPAGLMNFGRTNVGIWRVSIGVELGQGARIAEVARTVRPDTITPSRQASFWVDYGRGLLSERRSREQGLRALLRAEELAPQQVRSNVWAREAVTDLLGAEQRAAGGRDLRGLAWRMGIAPTG